MARIVFEMTMKGATRRLTAVIVAAVFVIGSFFLPAEIYAEQTDGEIDAAQTGAVTDAAQTDGEIDAAQADAAASLEELENLVLATDETGDIVGLEDLDESEYNGFIYKLQEDAAKAKVKEMEHAIEELEEGPDSGQIAEVMKEELYTADSIESIGSVASADMIEYIEPNYIVELLGTNDYYYDRTNKEGTKYSWYLDMIKAPYVWKKGQFGEGAMVAVVDSGVTMGHEDFENTQFVSPYNAIEDSDDVTDNIGHGTGMAGIIAASYNNQKGLTGIMPQAGIMPIKVVDGNSSGQGSGEIADLVKGINYAAEKGADVINLSLGDDKRSIAMEEACEQAAAGGAILVAAAGNDGDSTLEYPACFDKVVSVGSIEIDGEHSDFANVNEYVDVVAPGRGILYPVTPYQKTQDGKVSTIKYRTNVGTSFSTPQVSAMAAMIKSMDKSVNSSGFKKILKKTCLDKGKTGRDDEFGYGLMDLSRVYRYMTETFSMYKASLSSTSYVFNGKKKTPSVKLKKGTYVLPKTDYKVSYPSKRKAVGTYTVKVQGQGIYSGTKTLKFRILPPLVKKLKKPCRCKHKIKVNWYAMSKSQRSKYKTAITGYQVRLSKSSKFKDAKYVKVKGIDKTSVKVKGLKRKTTYYIQYRTYKKVGTTTYYSKWSSMKKARTK